MSLIFKSNGDSFNSTFDSMIDIEQIKSARKDIQKFLEIYNLDFEGRDLPVSIKPTVIDFQETVGFSSTLALIRSALLKLTDKFLYEYHNFYVKDKKINQLKTPLMNIFSVYEKWFDIICLEQRHHEYIQLMRFDTIRESKDSWKIMENNSHCPGGVIARPLMKEAWLNVSAIANVVKKFTCIFQGCDDKDKFLLFLHKLALQYSTSSEPLIILANYKGKYIYELETLQKRFIYLVNSGRISGKMEIIDISQINIKNNFAVYDNQQIALIYNKIDPLMIDCNDSSLEGWLFACKSPHTLFLNSCASMYLIETKRVLSVLGDPFFQDYIEFTYPEIQAITKAVPFSTIDITDPIIIKNKNDYVIKPDALTRGEGVLIGKECNPEQWQAAINNMSDYHGIAQKLLQIPKRKNFNLNFEPVEEYYGLDFYFYGDECQGATGRSSELMVFNVGSGGFSSPVLVIK